MSRQATLRAAAALAALAALSAAPLRAQAPEAYKPRTRRPSVSTAVHEAWLKEVLDLDPKGAAAAYDRIRRTAPKKQPERWIAVTRLIELHRLGVLVPEPNAVPKTPPPVSEALSLLDASVPYERLRANPRAEVELPALRPATRTVQDWVRNQVGPTVEERLRLRSRFTSSRSSVDEAARRRWYAYNVLYVELEGRRSQGEALRSLYFADWVAPRVSGAPADVLRDVRRRLEQWIDEEESSRQRAYLRDLQKGLDEQARIDPAAAIGLVQRLPLYAERLLGAEDAAAGDGR